MPVVDEAPAADTPPVPTVDGAAPEEEAEDPQTAFLRADADRLLDEAYERLRAAYARDPKMKVTAPQLFSAVHEDSAERPIIGGTAAYADLWAKVEAAGREQEEAEAEAGANTPGAAASQ